jgi:hypothetical protein
VLFESFLEISSPLSSEIQTFEPCYILNTTANKLI